MAKSKFASRFAKGKLSWSAWLFFLLMLVLGYLFGTRYEIKVAREPADVEVVEAADFIYSDLNGVKRKLSDFRGQVVLLDFWATWCGPCLEELPELKKLYSRYQDQGFEIVGVSIDEGDASDVRQYVRENQVPYVILLAGGLDAVPEAYQIRAIPTAFLIDRQGRIRKKILGFKLASELSKSLEVLLKE